MIVACNKRHTDVVRALIQHKDIDVTQENQCLLDASANGYDKIVDVLLTHKDIDVNFEGLTSGRRYRNDRK